MPENNLVVEDEMWEVDIEIAHQIARRTECRLLLCVCANGAQRGEKDSEHKRKQKGMSSGGTPEGLEERGGGVCQPTAQCKVSSVRHNEHAKCDSCKSWYERQTTKRDVIVATTMYITLPSWMSP